MFYEKVSAGMHAQQEHIIIPELIRSLRNPPLLLLLAQVLLPNDRTLLLLLLHLFCGQAFLLCIPVVLVSDGTATASAMQRGTSGFCSAPHCLSLLLIPENKQAFQEE